MTCTLPVLPDNEDEISLSRYCQNVPQKKINHPSEYKDSSSESFEPVVWNRWQIKSESIILLIAGWSSVFFFHLLPESSNSLNGHGISGMCSCSFRLPRSQKSMTFPELLWALWFFYTWYYIESGFLPWQNQLLPERKNRSFSRIWIIAVSVIAGKKKQGHYFFRSGRFCCSITLGAGCRDRPKIWWIVINIDNLTISL